MKRRKSEVVEEDDRDGAIPSEGRLRKATLSTEIEPENDGAAFAYGTSETATIETESATATPSKSARGRRKQNAIEADTTETPKKDPSGKKLFTTPIRVAVARETNPTPTIARNANRSARRKSTRTLIERTIQGNTSDNDEDEVDIAQQVYSSGEEGNAGEGDYGDVGGSLEPEVPVTPSRKRGRPKGSKNRERSQTPPQDLTAHETYFFHNRGGRPKTSNNNLSSLALLDHEEYFSRTRNLKSAHIDDIDFLESLHAKSFNQWQFELSQGFNICLYGWGSKRLLLMRFADHVYKSHVDHAKNKIVIVNGYVNNLTIKTLLHTVATAVSEETPKLGQPADMLDNVIALVEEDPDQSITLMIHSIDGAPLRRPAAQTIISRLSAHPQIRLIASADHPSFPLLWDGSLRSTFNFVFHDCTTFQAYAAELDVVDEVHELLGRSGRRVGGKEGVSFVLKSLPENAKNLFRVLIGEQLAAMDGNSGTVAQGYDDDDHDDNDQLGANNFNSNEIGVEYRVLYQKAVEEFICSNEMNFRTLLKE
jgi:origin recognition complex subunit 2